MISARSLEKRYGERRAVAGVSFDIAAGESFGLLGPNGAGKTTTILMIAGSVVPDGGELSIDGHCSPDQPEVRRCLGVAPQELAIYEELTGAENLAFFGRLYGLSGARLAGRVDWGLEMAGLTERRRDRAGKYSGGMKRRLNLACALVHEPKILFCDEPTVGVDPQSRNHIFESIDALKKSGMTLVYTTHYIEEAQRLCDRVAIIDHGEVLALDSVDALITAHGGASIVEAEFAALPAEPSDLPGDLDGKRLRVETDRPLEAIAKIARAGVGLRALHSDRPDLERVFLNLTGRRLRD